MKKMKFNEAVKELRIQRRLTLRDFCDRVGLDPSNWSKVERGINPPPNDSETLNRLASFFGLDEQLREDFLDSAVIQRGELPKDLADNVILQDALPAFFRAARGHELTEEERKNLFEDVLKLNKPDR
jgi:transcriptional regulator with XRE-family HTH domain